MKRYIHAVCACLLLNGLVTSLAWGQYIWIDDKGVKQYSDTLPPANIPARNIIRGDTPSLTVPLTPATDGSANNSAPSSANAARPASNPNGVIDKSTAKSTAPPTLMEQNIEFKKRQAEQVEKSQKALEEAKQSADKAKRCARARDYQKALSGDARITRTNAKGEKEFLTDDQRQQDQREAANILKDCK